MKKEILRKLHEFNIQALDEVVRICDKYNITYYLLGGTLLGAVRHKGFIPWDDDLDIGMPRQDLIKFESVLKSELGDRFFYQSMDSEKEYDHYFSKIRINNTLLIEANDAVNSKHQGIFIDIFPLDKGKKHIEIIQKIRWKFVKAIKYQVRMKRINGKVSGIHKLLNIFPLSFYESMMNAWKKRKGDCYVNYGSQYGLIKQTIPVEKYDPPIKLMFEGKLYNVPNDYDYVLRCIYGPNYMQLPPIEKRVTHNPIKLSFDTNGLEEDLSES